METQEYRNLTQQVERSMQDNTFLQRTTEFVLDANKLQSNSEKILALTLIQGIQNPELARTLVFGVDENQFTASYDAFCKRHNIESAQIDTVMLQITLFRNGIFA